MGLFDSLFGKATSSMGGVVDMQEINLDNYRIAISNFWNACIEMGLSVDTLDCSGIMGVRNAERIILKNIRVPEEWHEICYSNLTENDNVHFVRTWSGTGEGVQSNYYLVVPVRNMESYIHREGADSAKEISMKTVYDLGYIIECLDGGLGNFYNILSMVEPDKYKHVPIKLYGTLTKRISDAKFGVVDMSDVTFAISKTIFQMCTFSHLTLPKDLTCDKGVYTDIFSYCKIGSLYIPSIEFTCNCTLMSIFTDTKIGYLLVDEFISNYQIKLESFFGVSHISYMVVRDITADRLDISNLFNSKTMKELVLEGVVRKIIMKGAFVDSSFDNCHIPMIEGHKTDSSDFEGMVYNKEEG